jgi:hypothetical protein
MFRTLCPEHFPVLPPDSERLIFWEFTPMWGRFFLRQLREQIVAVPEKYCFHEKQPLTLLADEALFVYSAAEMREMSRRHPASFVFAEFTPQHYRELVARIPRLRQTLPLWRIAVVCFELPLLPIDEFEMFHAIFGEAGSTAVISTRTELLSMIPVVLSYFSNIPQKQTEWHENIVKRLPFQLH